MGGVPENLGFANLTVPADVLSGKVVFTGFRDVHGHGVCIR